VGVWDQTAGRGGSDRNTPAIRPTRPVATESLQAVGLSRYPAFLSAVGQHPIHRALGLTDGELTRIQELLGRDPNHFELAVFSLLWSEHCGYKHSALLLKRFPTRGDRVLQGPGENAGVLDLGEGEAVAFKVESHNHPSAVEPFQGAATGIGGILRDIVAMGARPVALLDGLRFGEPGWKFDRAVAGIGHYGNCLAGEESVVYRNSGTVRQAAIGELVELRGPTRAEPAWTASPRRPFQVLSFDPSRGEAVWRDVNRVFKREASQLLKIKTRLGRTLTVTPDHPVVLWEAGSLAERPASQVRAGDSIPLLCSFPVLQDVQAEIDLIDALDEPSIVRFPKGWRPSARLRAALRQAMPRADARHYWLSRSELPVAAFRKVEATAEVARRDLELRLTGPRSTPVPAVFPLDPDTARLIGYYLAEGCCSRSGSTFKIIWTFGRNSRDADYIRDVEGILDKLGIRHSREVRESTVAIKVSSRLLGRLLTEVLECGSRSHEKRIPPQLFDSTDRIREEVVKGILRSDGSISYPKTGSAVRIAHSTTSRALHEQLLLILQTLGVVAMRYDRRGGESTIRGRSFCSRTSYALEFSAHRDVARGAHWLGVDEAETILNTNRRTAGSLFGKPRSQMEGKLATVEVVEIEHVPGPAPVYDLEVSGTHLFVTSGGIVTHNCVGVPTVGGETFFDESYADNCLVNAMCVGLLPTERLTRAKARTPGHLLVLVGATTGRDGIGGASVLASQELGEGSPEKRPSVQIGDPFTGKRLIEVSLELVERRLVESLQDCGAAGLASALAEMARDGAGVDVHLDRVPLREELEPWEIMISESQERMVAVVRPGFLEAVEEVCARWELHCAPIGEVTDTGELRCFFDGEALAEIPAAHLTDEAPRYRVEPVPRQPRAAPPLPAGPPPARALVELLASPNVRSRAWIYERYDHLVGSRTVRRPGLDAAVLRLRPSLRGLAVSLDGPGRLADVDPWTGGAQAVLEAARNVACAGGEPLGLTDCLNFGNPEKPEVAWELVEAIEGMALAAEALGLPVVSGNVSLYNETDGRPIRATPVVGCVGLVPDVRAVPGRWREGDVVLLAGSPETLLAGSEYQALYGEPGGRPARLDLDAEALLVEFLWRASPLLSLAHDAAEGGLAVALAEAAIWSGLGAEIEIEHDADTLFGEGGGQAVLACPREHVGRLGGVPLRVLGVVGGNALLGVKLEALRAAWHDGAKGD
jgi:phosphoribosylformylglycinamidine synthase II